VQKPLSDTVCAVCELPTSELRFVPATNYNGTPGGLTARLVDSSATGLSQWQQLSTPAANGGSSAYFQCHGGLEAPASPGKTMRPK
jgi:hypothetical protein